MQNELKVGDKVKLLYPPETGLICTVAKIFGAAVNPWCILVKSDDPEDLPPEGWGVFRKDAVEKYDGENPPESF